MIGATGAQGIQGIQGIQGQTGKTAIAALLLLLLLSRSLTTYTICSALSMPNFKKSTKVSFSSSNYCTFVCLFVCPCPCPCRFTFIDIVGPTGNSGATGSTGKLSINPISTRGITTSCTLYHPPSLILQSFRFICAMNSHDRCYWRARSPRNTRNSRDPGTNR